MIVLAVVLAALACGALALSLVRVRLRFSVQAIADETTWALAGGGSIGPLALSGMRAAEGRAAWAVHLFGRKLSSASPERAARKPSRVSKVVARLRHRVFSLATSLDPIDLMGFGLDALGRMRVDDAVAKVRCGTPAPHVLGAIAGVVSVASATLAPVLPFARIESEIDWESDDDHGEVSLGLDASFVPLVVGWDVARLFVRQLRIYWKRKR